MKCYSCDWLILELLVKNNKGEGRDGLKRGGLINFLPLKRESLLEGGGLIEDL